MLTVDLCYILKYFGFYYVEWEKESKFIIFKKNNSNYSNKDLYYRLIFRYNVYFIKHHCFHPSPFMTSVFTLASAVKYLKNYIQAILKNNFEKMIINQFKNNLNSLSYKCIM